jgi:hypothetical protein
MARRFKPIQLLFWIPGLLLIGMNIYIPVEYAYKQLAWTRTEAHLVERIASTDRNDIAYSVLEFKDHSGKLHRIKEDEENTMVKGSDDQHFILYYNPTSPVNYVMMNQGRYLLILFFPFGLLLCFLGWPEKESKPAS